MLSQISARRKIGDVSARKNEQNPEPTVPPEASESMPHSGSAHSAGSAVSLAPSTVRLAAGIVAIQSLCVMAFGVFLIVRDIIGAENASMVTQSQTALHVGTGTAVFIFIIFGFALAGAWSMVNGKRWGHGGVVLVECILAASSFQMFTGGSPLLAVATFISSIAALYLILVAPATRQWFERTY